MQKFSDFFAKKLENLFKKHATTLQTWNIQWKILWAQSPTKIMHLRLYNFYEPKTPQSLWAYGPINFMNPRPHKLYKPKAPKNFWAQHPTNIVNPRPQKFYEPKAP